MNDEDQAREVRERMAALRRDLDSDVQNVTEGARAMADWRYYVQRFPVAAAAAVGVIGFLAVPKKAEVIVPDPETLAAMAKQNRVWVKTGAPTKSDKNGGMLSGLLAIAATGAARLAMNWASEQVKHSMSAKQESQATEDRHPTPESSHYPPR